ncbi:MAG: hypothetical protein KA978_15455, partial [Deltaproteobacteria bacterium]|nr:hypothetical protein [Deltaproteobacteria bacterium]
MALGGGLPASWRSATRSEGSPASAATITTPTTAGGRKSPATPRAASAVPRRAKPAAMRSTTRRRRPPVESCRATGADAPTAARLRTARAASARSSSTTFSGRGIAGWGITGHCPWRTPHAPTISIATISRAARRSGISRGVR